MVVDSLGTARLAANASDIPLAPHRCERVGCRLRLPSLRTRPNLPSTSIGTKPEGLVYPSPRLPLRSCGYLGFHTQPPLNPVGVVYAVTCGFTPLSAPRLTRIGPRRSPPRNPPRIKNCSGAPLYCCFIAPITPNRSAPHPDSFPESTPHVDNRTLTTPPGPA